MPLFFLSHIKGFFTLSVVKCICVVVLKTDSGLFKRKKIIRPDI